jgi:VanZ family protein
MKKLVWATMAFGVVHLIIFAGGLASLTDVNRSLFSGFIPHFTAFFTLACVLSLMLIDPSMKTRYPFVISCIYAIAVGVVLELIQLQTSYRTFAFDDMAVDTLGALVYCIIGSILYKKGYFKIWTNLK